MGMPSYLYVCGLGAVLIFLLHSEKVIELDLLLIL